MGADRISVFLRLAFWSLLAIPLTGCGNSDVSGAYVAKGQALYEKFDFQSDHKVAVTAFGQTMEGEYAMMDDGRVRIMLNGSVATLKDSGDGCLEVTAGDATEAKTAAQWQMDPSELGHFCRE